MVSARKQAYMKAYNMLPEVKARKAGYMKHIRASADAVAARKLVQDLLSMGFESLAFEYAAERAPEMLATVKVDAKRRK